MPITRRYALMSGAGLLTALPPLPVFFRRAVAQETDPLRALTRAYNGSGQQLFKELSATEGSLVFSPYSIGTAMAMALAGARGATERQMLEVLQHRLTRPEIGRANARALAMLNGYDKSAATPACPPGLQLAGERCEKPWTEASGCRFPARREGNACVAAPMMPPSAQLSVANALMLPRRDDLISNDYRALLNSDYAAEVFEGASLADINAWVARQTRGKIERILEQLDPTAVAVLLNAVYFKAKWASAFSRSQTRDEPFHLAAGQQVAVPTMRRRGSYKMAVRGGYRALRIPYEVEALGMVIVLPDAVDGVAAVGARLGEAQLSELFAAIRAEPQREVDLALPRFRLESKIELAPLFQRAGMTLAFGSSADFSGMTSRPQERIAISDVVHQAMIDVMEDGTEAAAATAVTMMRSSAPTKVEEFRVDRPFLFYLVDDGTGAILFEGRVSNPKA
jgi:serpin B